MARDNVPEDVFIFAVARLLECPVYLLEATVLTDVEALLKGLGFVGREWERTRGESNGCVGDLSRVPVAATTPVHIRSSSCDSGTEPQDGRNAQE